MIIGPPDTLYEGGFFKCHLYFPTEYPLRPPVLKYEILSVFVKFITGWPTSL